MDKLTLRRWHQVFTYGWRDAVVIATKSKVSRFSSFINIISAFSKWYIFSNQYLTNRLWELSENEKEKLAQPIGEENKRRDNWIRENFHNWKFLQKWTSLKYETSISFQQKRQKAYMKEFHAGEGLIVQFNVHIQRVHFLDGTIKMGKNVLLAKNVFIDYSGFVEIQDNVSLSDGVVIETHSHSGGKLKQTNLVIENSVWVCSKAIILESCHRIGHHALIGAGAVIRQNIPPHAIVVGNPAKIVGFLVNPADLVEAEKKYPDALRFTLEDYTKVYDKYFKNRYKEIKDFLKL